MQKLSDNQSTNTWLMPVHGVILMLMLSMVMPVWAGDVAMITYIRPNTDFTAFDRHGYEKILTLYGTVQDGDQITVRRGYMTLMMDKTIDTIKFGETKTVKGTGPDNGMIAAASNWFRSLWQSENKKAFLVAKGGTKLSLMMPMLEGKNAKIVANIRSLDLAWIGGEAPYTVQLDQKRNGDWFEVEKDVTSALSITLKKHVFRSNNLYRIVIRDATENEEETVDENFMVVASSPTLSDNLPKTQTWKAYGLAKQGEQWIFEAYQEVLKVRRHDVEYTLASTIKNGLILGKAPE